MCQHYLSPVSVITSEHPAAIQPSADAQLLMLSGKRKATKIPKGDRITSVEALADIVEGEFVGGDQSWERLTSFAMASLSTSSLSNSQSRLSLTAAMKTNI